MVVEITPIGIASIGWRFYIIWTVFNFAFIPIVYFFYPETADRSLEDIDRFFMANQSILIHKDAEATSSKRPQRYVTQVHEEAKRLGSAKPADVQAVLSRTGVAGRVDLQKADEEMGGLGHSHVERVSYQSEGPGK